MVGRNLNLDTSSMKNSFQIRLLWILGASLIALLAASPLALRGASDSSAGMPAGSGKLSGKIVVLAGRLPALTAAQATSLIEQAGGTVTDRVTRTTSFVVSGARPGKKVDEARNLGVRVVDEAELRRMLGLPQEPPKQQAQKRTRKAKSSGDAMGSDR